MRQQRSNCSPTGEDPEGRFEDGAGTAAPQESSAGCGAPDLRRRSTPGPPSGSPGACSSVRPGIGGSQGNRRSQGPPRSPGGHQRGLPRRPRGPPSTRGVLRSSRRRDDSALIRPRRRWPPPVPELVHQPGNTPGLQESAPGPSPRGTKIPGGVPGSPPKARSRSRSARRLAECDATAHLDPASTEKPSRLLPVARSHRPPPHPTCRRQAPPRNAHQSGRLGGELQRGADAQERAAAAGPGLRAYSSGSDRTAPAPARTQSGIGCRRSVWPPSASNDPRHGESHSQFRARRRTK